MTPLAWVLGLILPACGGAGAKGLPPPVRLNVARIERPDSPNTALAAPAGFEPTPDIETQRYPVPAVRLYEAIRAVAQSQPRTFVAAEFPDRLQADYVVRSAVFNFPDLVTIVAQDAGAPPLAQAGGSASAPPANAEAAGSFSTLIIWSRSVYGRSDLGVNRARITAWLDALNHRLSGP